MVEVHNTSAGKFQITKIKKADIPIGLLGQGWYKWDFLRTALATLQNKDDSLHFNCPNRKQASLAQSAIGNYHKRAGRGATIPQGCKLRSGSTLLKNGTVDVYVYFAQA